MTTSTCAFYYSKPAPDFGGMAPETPPGIIWGQGTPAAVEPFTIVNKGSLYMEVNGTDDESHCWMKVDEGGDAADFVKLVTTPYNVAQTYVDTELHGWELAQTANFISGGSIVGLNIVQTTGGTAGTWAAPLYCKVVQGTTKNVNGYITAGEFELSFSALASGNLSDHFVITLNYLNNDPNIANVQDHAYIALRDYGTASECRNLFWFADLETLGSVNTRIISNAGAAYETNCNTAIRIQVGTTPYWILATSTAP